jgi:homogentisate 1,2-dioxygenase
MLDRQAHGELPPKHHIALRDAEGRLRYEECFTRDGFDGPYTIMYHLRRPHTHHVAASGHGFALPSAAPPRPLAKRHFLAGRVPARAGAAAVDARVPLAFNDDVVIGVVRPQGPDPVYFANGDADDLYFVRVGGGLLRCPLGDLAFGPEEYVVVPRGLPHRFLPSSGEQEWLSIECLGGVGLLRQWRNEAGQLRMDAPYSHRDFRRPTFVGPMDEGIRGLVVKKSGAFHGFRTDESPLDVVGWDGTVYPFVFPILSFQPRVGLVHLPPTWHGTFAARGALVCSFVPRPVDFHPGAIPCPYPHSSPSCDEILYYVRGSFTSRKGVGPGSVSLHPSGVAHGPHPGAYEASIGTRETSELAVMIDTFKPLAITEAAVAAEDPGYQESFVG